MMFYHIIWCPSISLCVYNYCLFSFQYYVTSFVFYQKQNVRAFIIILGVTMKTVAFESLSEINGFVEKLMIFFVSSQSHINRPNHMVVIINGWPHAKIQLHVSALVSILDIKLALTLTILHIFEDAQAYMITSKWNELTIFFLLWTFNHMQKFKFTPPSWDIVVFGKQVFGP